MVSGDDLWNAAKIIREDPDRVIEPKKKIKMPPVSERINAIDSSSSIQERYVGKIIDLWYNKGKLVELDDIFMNALNDPKIAELVFSAALKKAYKTDEVLLFDKEKTYLQSDLLKMIFHEESGANGPLIIVDPKKKKLRILSGALEFKLATYDPEGDLREKASWAQYF